ncbi:peptide chain release factor N(5)-glutamine methyltransferase [Maritimibacter sp. DP1N21-5]|uniref:peptide chain release factor N(5)-glutamine methyltransferase n=1 Tax=Maritimibacter sp. DP1N21-5 TaxID=2836867 RepID=UPI001C47D30B|nr:peptide chain release factor N(5)-glutamine methyltransferase [Maritimibacter sp. DP1N21-5]MBV7409757.1 peptide chain release factor N(5)-glutamine methyltransferase [Maritimibacter sp. DP1N21-5]
MKLIDALRRGVGRLSEAGIEGANRDADRLLAHVLGVEAPMVRLGALHALTEEEARAFDAAVDRRVKREPVSRIVGRRLFWGRWFEVTPDVLDPRPETEGIIALVAEGPAPSRLLDLGTGSGILAVTLLAEYEAAQGVATDISPGALEAAARNAAMHGVAGRLELRRSDWFAGVEGTFDLIVSNPPYIAADELPDLAPEVLNHDPDLALTPGGDGLSPYRVIAGDARDHLEPGGRLLVEIGHRQGASVCDIFRQAGLDAVTVHPDMEGKDRIVSALAPR